MDILEGRGSIRRSLCVVYAVQRGRYLAHGSSGRPNTNLILDPASSRGLFHQLLLELNDTSLSSKHMIGLGFRIGWHDGVVTSVVKQLCSRNSCVRFSI